MANDEVKPLIQEMDQEVLKAMIKHKLNIVSSFFTYHPNANKCSSGTCEHDKIGTSDKLITIDESIHQITVDKSIEPLNVCIYMMPIISHLVDYELFKTFLPEN